MTPSSSARLPGEWEPHRATWVAWPSNRDTWPGVYDTIAAVWAEMIRLLRRHETVKVLTRDEREAERIREVVDLGEGEPVELHAVPTNDAWARDFAPIFTHDSDGAVIANVFRFDSWGGKYPPWEDDDAAGAEIARLAGVSTRSFDVVLEGGSIDSDGRGTILTTESCLVHAGRNPGLGRRDIESLLEESLGARRVVWLGEGIVGDDTDGHVDDLARFVAPGRVVTAVSRDPSDPDFAPLRENLERLRDARDAEGRPLDVAELPTPDPVSHGALRCPASYANFYIGNGSVLVPTYRCAQDEEALEILSELFHDREVHGIDCTNLVLGLGALHCVTMQEPRPLEEPSP